MELFLALVKQLIVGFVLQVIGYLLIGSPKAAKPDSVTDLENPTAEAGRPIPVVFGEMEVSGLNVLFYGEKHTNSYETKA